MKKNQISNHFILIGSDPLKLKHPLIFGFFLQLDFLTLSPEIDGSNVTFQTDPNVQLYEI